MNFKPYKISESYQNNKPVPFIRLKGKWLEELNFNIGEDIIVSKSKNKIIITKPNEEQQNILKFKKQEKEIKQLLEKLETIKN